MRFYTNVQLVGNNFLVRGYENGKHFMTRETFHLHYSSLQKETFTYTLLSLQKNQI